MSKKDLKELYANAENTQTEKVASDESLSQNPFFAEQEDEGFITKFNAAVGNKIKSTRLNMGLTQVKFSKFLGVSFQQLQKYENGANQMNLRRLLALLIQTGSDPGSFFSSIISEMTSQLPDVVSNVKPAFDFGDNSTSQANTNPQLAKDIEKLTHRFKAIKDDAVRKRILALVASIAASETSSQENIEESHQVD